MKSLSKHWSVNKQDNQEVSNVIKNLLDDINQRRNFINQTQEVRSFCVKCNYSQHLYLPRELHDGLNLFKGHCFFIFLDHYHIDINDYARCNKQDDNITVNVAEIPRA